jgi:ceramide glucosyltransferase
MLLFTHMLTWLLLVPVVAGSLYSLICLAVVLRFYRSRQRGEDPTAPWPAVTVLRPVCGLEKGLLENLRSLYRQDYPDYQVVLSVQAADDPALPLLRQVQQEAGSDRVSVVVMDRWVGPNGKVNNLVGGLTAARHDFLVISDSDVRLRPDYLRAILAPFADPAVGCVNTLYKVSHADKWTERIGLLNINADHLPSAIFAYVLGVAGFCLGPSVALRRSTLKEIGGLESLADYLAEDFEIGRRTWEAGQRVVLLPYRVDTVVDFASIADWWRHLVYWDQNSRAATPAGFFATVLVRAVPFALLFALARGLDVLGLTVLGATAAIRLGTAAGMLGWGFQDREGLRSLPWLLVRDLLGLATWALAFTRRTVVWRGVRYRLVRHGRIEAHPDRE